MTTIEQAVGPVLEQALAAARVPGAVLAVARGGRPIERLVVGADADGRPLTAETVFAVASITKLAVGLLLLRLAEAGRLRLDDELAAHLPEAIAARPGVTMRRLLCHTAGLPANLPSGVHPTDPTRGWPQIAAECLAVRPLWPPGARVQYSNVGYGLLGIAVERLTGRPFAEVLRAEVLRPLGLEAWLGELPDRPTARQADVRGPNAGTPQEQFNSPYWRRLGVPFGGCLMTADAALALVQTYRGRPGYLSDALLAEATSNQVGTLGGGQIEPLMWPHCPWGLGPELRGVKRPHWAPPEASPGSFGHAGASGCVAWADPSRNVAWALLGSRAAVSGWLLRVGPAVGAAILAAAD